MLKLSSIITVAALTLGTLANTAAIAASRAPADPARRAEQTARMKACGAEWKTAKADETIKAAGWPKFWSACNARHKAAKAD